MSALSLSPHERARAAHAAVLRSMGEPGTAKNVAQQLGTSESTVSRTKESLEGAMQLLYQLGWKVVASDRVCVDREMYEAMAHIAQRAMADKATAHRLIWEDD